MNDLPTRSMYRQLNTEIITRQEIYDNYCTTRGAGCPLKHGGSCTDCQQEIHDLITENLNYVEEPHKLVLWRLWKAAQGKFKIIDWEQEGSDKKPIKFWHDQVNPMSDANELLRRIGL